MWTQEGAEALAHELLAGMGARWSHVVAVGQTAARLAERSSLMTPGVVSAAWLHDIGYAPEVLETGMHAIDGARALQRLGAPTEVVALVAHHTGARFEAEERGLVDGWWTLPKPDPFALDILNLIDLSTSPTGQEVLVADRVSEILGRYEKCHPVHRAVTRSQHELFASADRAREALGLPDDWPVVPGEGMADP